MTKTYSYLYSSTKTYKSQSSAKSETRLILNVAFQNVHKNVPGFRAIMDFKGTTWVRNMYQKFETMCLEVEEIIVQDTAKFVENQAQTVGNTVKKFCSDVVQDLLPDDSVGSRKPLPISVLHEYAPVCSFKKKRESMNRETRYLKKEQEVTEGKKDGCAMKVCGVNADDYDICTSPRKYSYAGPYRRTRVGHKQIFKKEELFQVTRPYLQKNSNSLSMVHRTRVKNDVGTVKPSDSPPGEGARFTSKNECQKDDRTENQQGLTVVNSVRSHDSEIITENEHAFREVNSVRSQDSKIQPFVSTLLPAGSDDCRKETKEDSMETNSSSLSEKKSEIFQQLSGKSVEESCIIVDREDIHCVFPDKKENNQHKPYKKIRGIISSRMKQNREKEYKRLARQYHSEDVENGREDGDNPKPLEENRSSEESEWELV